jgi:hypothetical protein
MKLKVLSTTSILCAILFASCASTNVQVTNATIEPATLDLGSLPRDQYIIIGQVSGEGIIVAKDSDIRREAKLKALQEPVFNTASVEGDNGRYGFLGEQNTNMTILEKAIAMGTYKMIKAAQYNGADTVIYVTTTTTIVPKSHSLFSKESTVTAKVSGLAVKIKPNDGIKIKVPQPEEQVFKQVELEDPAPVKIDDSELSSSSEKNASTVPAETTTENVQQTTASDDVKE